MNLPEKTKQVGGQLVKVSVVFSLYDPPFSELYVCQKLTISVSSFLQSSAKDVYNPIHLIFSPNSGLW